MADTTGAPASARPRRCANHPGVAGVGTCELCGRSLCIACAVPVRGTVIGPECLGSVVEDAPPGPPPSLVIRPGGDRLAIAGFGLVTVLSFFPWSKFGDSSRFLGAWSLHWSLAAAGAGVIGLLFAVSALRRPSDPMLEALVYAALGLVVIGASLLHHHHPPPLTIGSLVAWLAVIGGVLAVVGAGLKGLVVLRATRALP